MKPQLLPCPRKLRRISGASRLDEATPVATQRSAALPPEGYALTSMEDAVRKIWAVFLCKKKKERKKILQILLFHHIYSFVQAL